MALATAPKYRELKIMNNHGRYPAGNFAVMSKALELDFDKGVVINDLLGTSLNSIPLTFLRNISTPFNAPDRANVRKVRRKRQKSLVKKMCYEYSQSTSLQGIPYFTKRGLTSIEKIFWMITFVVSLSMCSYLIRDVWIKWQTSPVIVTVSEELVAVIKVPLPSITICPQAKCMATVYNYTAEMRRILRNNKDENITFEEREKFEGLSLMCGDHKNSKESFRHLMNAQLHHHNATAVKYMNEVALDYKDIFKSCEVSNKTINCSKLFSKVLTARGICYTMNALAAEEIFRLENLQRDYSYMNTTRRSERWSLEKDYDDDLLSNSTFYPDRGYATDEAPNVYILFAQRLDEHDEFCYGFLTGFKVYIHHPADLPQASLYSHSLMNDQDALLALSFSKMKTAENLRTYDPEIRQCYFPEDKQLKYFKIYTAKNCRIECLSNFTFATCKCVQYHMPHHTSNSICTLRERTCVKNAHDSLAHRESDESIEDRCRCLPACNSIQYEGTLHRNPINIQQAMTILDGIYAKEANFSKIKFSRLQIFYKSPRFISMRRSALYGIPDFLAACGGLLGLFLGFSFLSIAEIFYFSTLRVCCALKEDRELEREEAKEKQDLNREELNETY